MDQISHRKVLTYRYEDEAEAERHERYMTMDGWRVDSREHFFIKHFRQYSVEVPQGTFL